MNNDSYAKAFDEIERGEVDKGLWARAFAEKGGEERATKARYVELRAAELRAQESGVGGGATFAGFTPPPNLSSSTLPAEGDTPPTARVAHAQSIDALVDDEWHDSPRPWTRLFARYIDNTIYLFVGFFTITIIAEASGAGRLMEFLANPFVAPIAFLPMAIVFEGAFAAMGIRPPGKALLNLRVRHAATGQRLDFSGAAYRMVHVWLRGMWMGMPLLSLIGMALNAGHLRKHGITAYDQSLGTIVESKELGFGRMAVVAIFIVAITTLLVIAQTL